MCETVQKASGVGRGAARPPPPPPRGLDLARMGNPLVLPTAMLVLVLRRRPSSEAYVPRFIAIVPKRHLVSKYETPLPIEL